MTDMPEFIRKAIDAQGKVNPDEVVERLDEESEETLLGVVMPEEPAQETIDLGVPVEPADHS